MQKQPGAGRHLSTQFLTIGLALGCWAAAGTGAHASPNASDRLQIGLSPGAHSPPAGNSWRLVIPIPAPRVADTEAGVPMAEDKKTKKELWDIFKDDVKEDTKKEEEKKKKEEAKKKKKKKEEPKERTGNSGSGY